MKDLGTIIWFIIKSVICGLILRQAILTVNVPLAIIAMAIALWMGWRQHVIVTKNIQTAPKKSLLDQMIEEMEKEQKASEETDIDRIYKKIKGRKEINGLNLEEKEIKSIIKEEYKKLFDEIEKNNKK